MFGSPFVVNWCLYFTSAAQLSNGKRLQVSRFGSHFRCSIEVMCSGEEKRSLRQKFHYRLLRKTSQLLKLLLDNLCKQSACNTFTDKSSLSYRNTDLKKDIPAISAFEFGQLSLSGVAKSTAASMPRAGVN